MKYINSILMPGEQVLAQGQIHWIVYAPGVLSAIAAVVFIPTQVAALAILFGVAALWLLAKAWLRRACTELAVTNKRIVTKRGFIRRESIEINHRQIELVAIDQSIWDRLLGMGTVIIKGSGSDRTNFGLIDNPIEFKKAASLAVEQADGFAARP